MQLARSVRRSTPIKQEEVRKIHRSKQMLEKEFYNEQAKTQHRGVGLIPAPVAALAVSSLVYWQNMGMILYWWQGGRSAS